MLENGGIVGQIITGPAIDEPAQVVRVFGYAETPSEFVFASPQPEEWDARVKTVFEKFKQGGVFEWNESDSYIEWASKKAVEALFPKLAPRFYATRSAYLQACDDFNRETLNGV